MKPKPFGIYQMARGFITLSEQKTMEAECKKRLKKEIIKRRMKWIPSTFKTIVHEPDLFNEWTTSVAVKVLAIPQKRYR